MGTQAKAVGMGWLCVGLQILGAGTWLWSWSWVQGDLGTWALVGGAAEGTLESALHPGPKVPMHHPAVLPKSRWHHRDVRPHIQAVLPVGAAVAEHCGGEWGEPSWERISVQLFPPPGPL